MMPPTNACNDITDDDSGDEDLVTINNLPGSQLRSEAGINKPPELSDYADDDDDNIPLSIVKLYCQKKKTYEWINEDIQLKQ